MTDFLNELADYLEVTAGIAPQIFAGIHPSDPDDCVSLLGLPGTNLGPSRDVAALTFPRFQAVTRSVDYATASDYLSQVRDALHGMIAVSLPSYRILRCHCEQEGGPIGQDGQGRYEFSINFTAEHHYTGA